MKFERTYTVYSPETSSGLTNTIPIPLTLPGGQPELEMEAWTTGSPTYSIFIIEGNVSSYQVDNNMLPAGLQGQAAADGGTIVDVIMCVPSGGIGKVRIQPDLEIITVVFRQSDAFQAATVKIREV